MDIKKIRRRLSFILGCCMCGLLFNSCIKKITGCVTDVNTNNYTVEIPVNIYPARDTFNIGDTIWIEQDFSENLYDSQNGLTLDFSEFYFGTQIVISDLIDFSTIYLKHNYFAEVGQISPTGISGLYIDYKKEGGKLKHKMGMVFTDSGLYKIGMFSTNYEGPVDFTRCPTEYLDLRFTVNQLTDNNFYMTKNSLDSNVRNGSKETFDKLGSYCFYVK